MINPYGSPTHMEEKDDSFLWRKVFWAEFKRLQKCTFMSWIPCPLTSIAAAWITGHWLFFAVIAAFAFLALQTLAVLESRWKASKLIKWIKESKEW